MNFMINGTGAIVEAILLFFGCILFGLSVLAVAAFNLGAYLQRRKYRKIAEQEQRENG